MMKKLSCEESGKIADVYHFLKSSLNGFVEREQQKDVNYPGLKAEA